MYNLYTEAAGETRERKNPAFLFFCLRGVGYNDGFFLHLPFFRRTIETYTTVTYLWRNFQHWSAFYRDAFLMEDTVLSFLQGLPAQIGSTKVKRRAEKEYLFFFLQMLKNCFTQLKQSHIGFNSPIACLQEWSKINTEDNLRLWFTHRRTDVCMYATLKFPTSGIACGWRPATQSPHSQSAVFHQSIWL